MWCRTITDEKKNARREKNTPKKVIHKRIKLMGGQTQKKKKESIQLKKIKLICFSLFLSCARARSLLSFVFTVKAG